MLPSVNPGHQLQPQPTFELPRNLGMLLVAPPSSLILVVQPLVRALRRSQYLYGLSKPLVLLAGMGHRFAIKILVPVRAQFTFPYMAWHTIHRSSCRDPFDSLSSVPTWESGRLGLGAIDVKGPSLPQIPATANPVPLQGGHTEQNTQSCWGH
ncbi:hypothetical protein GX51_00551 [Blastomyces parvus]|uniref:Uncharacterized protein n=1 Tax=Blastomyces parvus TaxID=2060905 RepID=A0A2B7XJV3_9EURO|nr:hypothetical protein GX51_00551 [Blastomyces parvus]